MRKSPTFARPLVCVKCGREVPRRSAVQKYCEPCSEQENNARRLRWSRANPKPPMDAERSARRVALEKSKREAASTRSSQRATSLIASAPGVNEPNLVWYVRFSIPFSQAVSKNHVWSISQKGGGHIFKRRASNDYKNLIAFKIKEAIKSPDIRVANGKIWIDIFVQKANHRSDAINALDLVADGLKEGLGVDDRWFSVRSIDWEIVKSAPQIFIGVGQETLLDSRSCAWCGGIKPLDHFAFHSRAAGTRTRVCLECSHARKQSTIKSVHRKINQGRV